jgi:hypothetical protein
VNRLLKLDSDEWQCRYNHEILKIRRLQQYVDRIEADTEELEKSRDELERLLVDKNVRLENELDKMKKTTERLTQEVNALENKIRLINE